MHLPKIRLVAILTTTFALALAACGGSPAAEPSSSTDAPAETPGQTAGGSSEITTVTLRHSWIPDDLYLPVAAAKDQGFYEEVGINLVDQVGNGGATSVQLVANGNIDIGVGEASHVITARSQGLPIINIATQLQSLPSAVIALKDSNITSWEDLVGKKVGGAVTSSAYAGFLTALGLQGIDADSVEFVNLPPGANFTALQDGSVDASLTFLGNIAALDYRDDLDVMTFQDAGLRAPSTGFFVSEDFLADNKDLLTRFLQATLKGLRYAIDNPEEASAMLATQWANVDAEQTAAKWDLNLQFVLTDTVEEHGLGWQDAEAWEAMASSLLEVELIESEVDTSEAFTNELVESIPADQR